MRQRLGFILTVYQKMSRKGRKRRDTTVVRNIAYRPREYSEGR